MAGIIISIRREVLRQAQAEGIAADVAVRIAGQVCSAICRSHGGAREYIPAPDVRERNHRIVKATKSGVAHSEIAKTEGVHTKTVSRVVALEFGSDEWAL